MPLMESKEQREDREYKERQSRRAGPPKLAVIIIAIIMLLWFLREIGGQDAYNVLWAIVLAAVFMGIVAAGWGKK